MSAQLFDEALPKSKDPGEGGRPRSCTNRGIAEFVKVVGADSVVCVGCENGFAVAPVVQTDHPDPLPRIEDDSLRVALVELARLAAARDLGAVRGPRNRRQLILTGVRDLPFYLASLHVPYANLQHVRFV